MLRVSTADLRELEVINLCGGARLGYPCDFEIDVENARILAIIVCCAGGLPFFSKKEEYIIPWRQIECIGEDAILVKLSDADLSACSTTNRSNGKKRSRKM